MSGVTIGRYSLFDEIGSGGMASVHLGRLAGPAGFSKTVAIKRMHPHLAKEPECAAMFLDEARLASRVRHPNVVPILDVVPLNGELLLVMEYVLGDSLSALLRRLQASIPPPIASAILIGALHGLHAAHEATDGVVSLDIVHRDVSPQNILVGVDGVPRVLDFGIAKAVGRVATTETGQVKGKAPYMAPEQLRGATLDRRADVYAASVVLWEALTGTRLFSGAMETVMLKVLEGNVPPPSSVEPSISPELDALVLRGLSQDREERFPTAREMAIQLEALVPPATPHALGEWVQRVLGDTLEEHARRYALVDSGAVESLPVWETATAPGSDELGAAASSRRGELRTVSEPSMARAVKRRRLAAGGLVGLLGGGTALVALLASAGRSVAVPRGGATVAESSAGPSAEGERAAASVPVGAPVTSAASSVSANAAPSVAPSAPPAARSASVAAKPVARPARSARPAEPEDRSCNPPYKVDVRGVKVPKPWCL